MARLSHKQYQLLADCLLKLYAFSEEETWHADVAHLLPRAVDTQGIVSMEALLPFKTDLTIPVRAATKPHNLYSKTVMETIVRYNNEDPIAQYFLKKRDLRHASLRSDFVTRSQWHRSALYNEVYRPCSPRAYRVRYRLHDSWSHR